VHEYIDGHPELTADAIQKALLEADAEFLKTDTKYVANFHLVSTIN